MACTWLSISPGIRVRLPQSITAASAALIGFSLSSLTVSRSTKSSWPPRNSPNDGSSSSKFLNRSCFGIGDSSLQPILVKKAALHDHRQVLALPLQQLQILEGIAVDDKQIRKCVRLHTTDLALHAHNLRTDRRGRTDDLGRRQHLRTQRKFLRLRHLQLAEQIGTVGNRHTVTLADLQ